MEEGNQVREDPNETRLRKVASNLGTTLLDNQATKEKASKLLLEGWTMLGDLCPITEYPLFRNKKTGEIWSVRLQMPVQHGGGGGSESSINDASILAAQHRGEIAPPQQSIGTQATNGVDVGNNLQQRPTRNATADVTKIIGEKLLLGWELLHEEVDGCPLMKDPSNGLKWLPTTGQHLPGSSTISPSKFTSSNSSSKTETRPNGIRKADFDDDDWNLATTNEDILEENVEDAISNRISEKMLMGWSMLYEHCPVHKTCPLLLDPRTGRKWSAALNDYIKAESMKAPAPKISQQITSVHASSSLELVVTQMEQKIVVWSQQLYNESEIGICMSLMAAIRDAVVTIREVKSMIGNSI